MNKWNVIVSRDDRLLNLKLQGRITEESVYPEIDYQAVEKMDINLNDIELMNSIGIQRWILFFKKIPASVKVRMVECPTMVTNQINIFPDFTDKRPVDIASFYVPYFCAACNKQEDILMDETTISRSNPSGKFHAPADVACPHCGSLMEFDDIESTFFIFLQGKQA